MVAGLGTQLPGANIERNMDSGLLCGLPSAFSCGSAFRQRRRRSRVCLRYGEPDAAAGTGHEEASRTEPECWWTDDSASLVKLVKLCRSLMPVNAAGKGLQQRSWESSRDVCSPFVLTSDQRRERKKYFLGLLANFDSLCEHDDTDTKYLALHPAEITRRVLRVMSNGRNMREDLDDTVLGTLLQEGLPPGTTTLQLELAKDWGRRERLRLGLRDRKKWAEAWAMRIKRKRAGTKKAGTATGVDTDHDARLLKALTHGGPLDPSLDTATAALDRWWLSAQPERLMGMSVSDLFGWIKREPALLGLTARDICTRLLAIQRAFPAGVNHIDVVESWPSLLLTHCDDERAGRIAKGAAIWVANTTQRKGLPGLLPATILRRYVFDVQTGPIGPDKKAAIADSIDQI